jgi:hydrogenase maturation protease
MRASVIRARPNDNGASPVKVLVAGIGNLFRSDDGFGAEVARVLGQRSLPAGVRVVDYGIRGMHLAFELLDGWDVLIVVDTVPSRGEPGTLHVIEVGPNDVSAGVFDAHGMDPASMLASVTAVGGTLPRTIVVGCEPETLADGMGLSAPVAAAVEPAIERVLKLVDTLAAPSTPSAR